MEQLKKVVESEDYKNLIIEIQKKIRIKVLDQYKDLVATRDEQKMQLAGMSIDDIESILKTEKAMFLNFAIKKISKFEKVRIIEEYPMGEELEYEENNETILGYSKGFLIIYLIEFYLLKNDPNKLEAYIKAIKIPQASKYVSELKNIYTLIQN